MFTRLLVHDVPVVDVVPDVEPDFDEVRILLRRAHPGVLLLADPRDALPLVGVDIGELALHRAAKLIDRIGHAFEIGRGGFSARRGLDNGR